MAAMTALRSVLHRVRTAGERSGRDPNHIRVIALSKTKPVTLIRGVYDAGYRCFGENYVQEIVEKANKLPEDVEWHFIGHLQTNKVKILLSKSGVDPSDCVALTKHVKMGCPKYLEFCGLMTIGMPDYTSTPEDYKTLLNCRTAVCKAVGIPEEHCELSMGMSGDFELATAKPS
ncbi:hypothetical protein Droror1_Dr00014871 [Drosera rotundifolia]